MGVGEGGRVLWASLQVAMLQVQQGPCQGMQQVGPHCQPQLSAAAGGPLWAGGVMGVVVGVGQVQACGKQPEHLPAAVHAWPVHSVWIAADLGLMLSADARMGLARGSG